MDIQLIADHGLYRYVVQCIVEYPLYSYLIIFGWTFVEGETIVLIAAFMAAQGLLDPLLLLVVSGFGSYLGDQCYFWLGRHYGVRLLKRFPSWRPGVENALSWLERYDVWFILSFRFIYGVRNFSSFAWRVSLHQVATLASASAQTIEAGKGAWRSRSPGRKPTSAATTTTSSARNSSPSPKTPIAGSVWKT